MRFLEKFIPIFSWLCGAVMLIAISSITGYLLLKGLKTINLQLIFGTTDPLVSNVNYFGRFATIILSGF